VLIFSIVFWEVIISLLSHFFPVCAIVILWNDIRWKIAKTAPIFKMRDSSQQNDFYAASNVV